jgi:hypothetical protein
MSGNSGKTAAATVMISLAVVEHVALIWYGHTRIIADRQHPTDMPVDTVFGIALYLAVGVSILGAACFLLLLNDVEDRLLWAGGAMALVPLTVLGLMVLLGVLLGLGWLLAAVIGGVAPYVVSAMLLRSNPRERF